VNARVLLVVAMVVIAAALRWIGVGIDVLIAGAVIGWMVNFYPVQNCLRCGGTKSRKSLLWPGGKRRCPRCGGSGQRASVWVSIFRPDDARKIRRGERGRNY
jgi:hypothetical protein